MRHFAIRCHILLTALKRLVCNGFTYFLTFTLCIPTPVLHTPGVTLRLTAKLRLSDGTPLLLLLRTQGGVPSLRTLFMFLILIELYPSTLFCQVVFSYHWNTVFAILSHFFYFRNVQHMKLIKWLKIDSDTLQSGTQFRPHLVTYRMCYTQTVDFSMHSRENGSLCNTHFAQNSQCVTIKTPFKFAASRESVDLACNALFPNNIPRCYLCKKTSIPNARSGILQQHFPLWHYSQQKRVSRVNVAVFRPPLTLFSLWL